MQFSFLLQEAAATAEEMQSVAISAAKGYQQMARKGSAEITSQMHGFEQSAARLLSQVRPHCGCMTMPESCVLAMILQTPADSSTCKPAVVTAMHAPG